MGKALVVSGPRQLAYETYADPALKPDEVRIQTLYSGISAGTEMTQYRGTNPYMNKRWDETTRLYVQSDVPDYIIEDVSATVVALPMAHWVWCMRPMAQSPASGSKSGAW